MHKKSILMRWEQINYSSKRSDLSGYFLNFKKDRPEPVTAS